MCSKRHSANEWKNVSSERKPANYYFVDVYTCLDGAVREWKGERFPGSRLHNSSRDRNFSKPVFDDRWQRGIDENRAPKHKSSYAGLINITHTAADRQLFQCSAQTPTRFHPKTTYARVLCGSWKFFFRIVFLGIFCFHVFSMRKAKRARKKSKSVDRLIARESIAFSTRSHSDFGQIKRWNLRQSLAQLSRNRIAWNNGI